MTEDDPDGFESDWESAAEWGLASLFVGAVSVVAGLLCLLLVAVAEGYARRDWNDAARLVAGVVGSLGWVALVAVAAAGIRYGRRSMAAARRRGQPVARGRAGVLLSGFGLFAALGTGLAWTLVWIDLLR